MAINGYRGVRAYIVFVIALTMLFAVPAASAQLGTSVRVDANLDGGLVDRSGELVTNTTDDLAKNATGGATGAATNLLKDRVAQRIGAPDAPSPGIRLHTRMDANLVESLVTSALAVPDVQQLIGPKARLDVAVDNTHFQVDIAGGAVAHITQTARVADADFTIRAGNDAARSLANAADPGFTAVRLLQHHYVTVEAAKLTHQAGLKAFFSGFLDGQLNVADGLEDATFEGEATAAEQAIRASGLRIVRVDGKLYAANALGGLVAALHDGSRTLGDPPADLGIRLSGIAGGATMDTSGLRALFASDPAADALRAALRDAGPPAGATLGIDAARAAALEAKGAPHSFLAGLGATELAHARITGDDA